ncbi:MAG: tetratricopeptide repeat protein [Candidatus Gastranaerophilales bacterium]|nr:tetratricopeptide repeat protein [Candidatus Gastranaerophilales bacterium]
MIYQKVEKSCLLRGKDKLEETLNLAQQSHENYLLKSSKEDLENAINYYIKAIKLNPRADEPYYRLANLLWENGQIDLDSAIEQCNNAIELNPKSSMARLYKGYFLKISENFEEAEEEFKMSINLAGFLSAKPRLALASSLMKKMQNTSANFNDAVQWLYYFITGTSLMIFDYTSIKMLYRGFIEDFSVLKYRFQGLIYEKINNYDNAIDTYKHGAQDTGRKDFFYSKMADISLGKGNPYQAVECYKTALKTSPENIVLWAKLASTLQKYYSDDVDELANCFTQLSGLEPENSRIFYELGHLNIKMENKLNAVSAFKRALTLEPNNPFYHNSLAYAYIQMENYDDAISEYQIAIKINPDNEWTSVVSQALGAIYHQVKGNIDASILSYQTAILLDSSNIDAHIALGEAYQDKEDWNNAINSYCEVIKLNPNIPRVYSNMAMALWEKEYIDEALIAYNKAVELNPNNDIAFNNLGVIYLDELKEPVKALEMFNSATQVNPNYTLAYYNKGRAYEMIDEKTQAAKAYQMVIDLNNVTNEFDAHDAEERLFRLFDV